MTKLKENARSNDATSANPVSSTDDAMPLNLGGMTKMLFEMITKGIEEYLKSKDFLKQFRDFCPSLENTEERISNDALISRMNSVEKSMSVLNLKIDNFINDFPNLNNVFDCDNIINDTFFDKENTTKNINKSDNKKLFTNLFNDNVINKLSNDDFKISNNDDFVKVGKNGKPLKPTKTQSKPNTDHKTKKSSKYPSIIDYKFVLRILTKNEKKRLFDSFPILLILNKLKDDKTKFDIINHQLKYCKISDNLLNIKNLVSIFYRNGNFCAKINYKKDDSINPIVNDTKDDQKSKIVNDRNSQHYFNKNGNNQIN